MGLDFFGLNDKCSVRYCNILVLIVIIFTCLLLLTVIYFIRRKMRSRKAKIQSKIKKTASKKRETLPDLQTVERMEKKPSNSRFLKPKIIEKQRKMFKIFIPKNPKNSLDGEKTNIIHNTELMKLDVKFFKEKPEVEKNKVKEKKPRLSNFLINESLYQIRLRNKKQMYPDDRSIQYENCSDLCFESKQNSIPNLINANGKKEVEKEKCMETKEKFIKVVIFEKKEEFVENRECRKNFYIEKDFDGGMREEGVKNTNVGRKESVKIIDFDEEN